MSQQHLLPVGLDDAPQESHPTALPHHGGLDSQRCHGHRPKDLHRETRDPAGRLGFSQLERTHQKGGRRTAVLSLRPPRAGSRRRAREGPITFGGVEGCGLTHERQACGTAAGVASTSSSSANRANQERIDQRNKGRHARRGEHRHRPERSVSTGGFDDTCHVVMNGRVKRPDGLKCDYCFIFPMPLEKTRDGVRHVTASQSRSRVGRRRGARRAMVSRSKA